MVICCTGQLEKLIKKIEIIYNENSSFSHDIELAQSSQGNFNKRANICFLKADRPQTLPGAFRGKRNLIYGSMTVENSVAVGGAGIT